CAMRLGGRDITEPRGELAVLRPSPIKSSGLDTQSGFSVEDAGFDRQPPAKTWAFRLDPSLRAADGQTLGYPWVAIIENWHERAFTSFGDGHGVWETDGGPLLPFYARNYRDLTQWLAPLSLTDLVPRILALEDAHLHT